MSNTYIKDDYESFQGYAIDDTWSYIPSLYWYYGQMVDLPLGKEMRRTFDAMAYTIDGRAAADASSIRIKSCIKDGKNLNLTYEGTEAGIESGHGCVVVFENSAIIFPVITSDRTMTAYNTDDPYETVPDDVKENLLYMATVYPTLRVPVIYKPFFGEVSAATWNLTGMTLERNDEGVSYPKRVKLPISYKVEGIVHNGLTYNNKFYLGETSSSDDTETIYETYMIFPYMKDFYEQISGFLTREDYEFNRSVRFGQGSKTSGFFREVDGVNESIPDTDVISYSITEGFPKDSDLDNSALTYTGRYVDGFDLYRLQDECNLSSAFYDNLRIKAFTDEGISGRCCVYADALPNSAETMLYYTESDIFNDLGVLEITSDGSILSQLANRYCYGYYNKNAEFDEKGASVKVVHSPITGTFTFGKTQDNGSKITKTVMSENRLFEEGVCLQHKFNIRPEYADYVSGISKDVDNGMKVYVATQSGETLATNFSGESFSEFDSLTKGTLIAEHIKQPDGSKNSMVVYKLFPVRSLEVIYPVEASGMKPFISVPGALTCSYGEQTVSITVSTNIQFKVRKGDSASWATTDTTSVFDPETTTITANVNENTGSTDRQVSIIFENAESLFDEQGQQINVSATCTIKQLKTGVTNTSGENSGSNNNASNE